MIHIVCIALAAAGFALLAAAMDRHQKDLVGSKLPPASSRRLRMAGATMLVATLVIGTIGPGLAVGVIAWFGHLTAGAAIVLTWLCWNTARTKSPNKAGAKK